MTTQDGGDSPGTEEPSLSLDAVLDLLAHRHRREMLRALRDAPDGAVTGDEVIRRLQEQEQRRTGELPSWDALSAELHHVHGPKLGQADVVSYDESQQEYQYQGSDLVERWLDNIDSMEQSEQ